MADGADLTYVTEKIITLSFHGVNAEEAWARVVGDVTRMLASKHGQNYLIINLSERIPFLSVNQKVLETGWVEFLAPNLDQICSVCTTMENWLQTHSKHVLVLHCKGSKGRIGVLLASYIHFTDNSPSAELSLDHYAMRRFYNDNVSALMTPSQKRYTWMLGGLLRGGMRMRSSPSFLLCVAFYSLPKIRPNGGCCLFLKVYQNLQAVCTSAVYHVQAGRTDRLYVVLQPAQLLKGDIMVVCYDKNRQSASREVIFRLQFHTGVIYGHTLTFSKVDLDCASEDSRFPVDGRVELMFSDSPKKLAGSGLWHNADSVTMDYDTLDPLVRRDSYQHTSPTGTAVPPVLSSVDHGRYARVGKSSVEDGAGFPSPPRSPRSPRSRCSSIDWALSASSDSGLSVTSQRKGGMVPLSSRREEAHESQDPSTHSGKLHLGLHDPELAESAPGVMANSRAGVEREVVVDECSLGQIFNGERETDILDDEEEAKDEEAALPGSAGIGPLSSLGAMESEYSTQAWVQRQAVNGLPYTYSLVDGEKAVNGGKVSPLSAPVTPPRRTSSREAVLRVAEVGTSISQSTNSRYNTHFKHSLLHTPSPSEDPQEAEEMASLATDIDESIEQLNQLILDLDPTFVPVPTNCSPLSRSASLHSNGLSHEALGHTAGWQQQRQVSDVTDYSCLSSPERRGSGAQMFRNSPANADRLPPPLQLRPLGGMDSMDYGARSPLLQSCDIVPPTPAFPVSPPTPYVKSFSAVSQPKSAVQWEPNSTAEDSRGFLDGISHAGGSTEGELFRAEVSVTPTSCQRNFGSMRSVSSSSPLSHMDSPAPAWQDRTPSSLSSSFLFQHSPPPSLSTPNAHTSPRGTLRGLAAPTGPRGEMQHSDLSSLLLGNGALEHSLLEAVEGLGGLGLGLDLDLDLGLDLRDGSLPPLLPEKRRGGEGGELYSPSPSLSGFSSTHSGSPSLGGAPSPGAELPGSKQVTVKFVQDTSRFWYKPDISRDQAIAVLKDKEPGSFIVRDSHSFRGAYGLAMKVATPPPSVLQQSKKAGDLSNELVRHFLIECTQKGVRLKGCPNEPYFGSLTALVCQHSITPLALPCKLILPDRDPMEELNDSSPQTATNSAAELLKQGAACNVWYLGSVELESLTGHQAVQKATSQTLAMESLPTSTVVHFKVSAQGITLTDNQRKLFFRRHYTVNTVIFCSLDPQGRKWTREGGSTAKIFGFVARKSQSGTENVCHLFAEHDPEQPASAIVNFVSKVMIGSHKK